MTSSFDQLVTFLPVSDLDLSALFYAETLGLDLVLDQGDCRIYRVSSSSFIGICVRAPATSGGTMVTLVTDDVDGWHARLEAAGVPCDKPPRINDTYKLHHAFYRDPDGHVIEIQQFLDPAWPT